MVFKFGDLSNSKRPYFAPVSCNYMAASREVSANRNRLEMCIACTVKMIADKADERARRHSDRIDSD